MTDVNGSPVDILLVEDDFAHAEIVRRNFERFHLANRVTHLSNGQDALDYLLKRGAYSDPGKSRRPGIILLDLRLPLVDGLEVLKTIKSVPDLAHIPVVILTTSAAEVDMVRAYNCHANSYLVKPLDHIRFIEMMETFGYYWLLWNQYPLRTFSQ